MFYTTTLLTGGGNSILSTKNSYLNWVSNFMIVKIMSMSRVLKRNVENVKLKISFILLYNLMTEIVGWIMINVGWNNIALSFLLIYNW